MELNQWLHTELGQNIWKSKYQYNNETLDEWFDRVSGGNQNIIAQRRKPAQIYHLDVFGFFVIGQARRQAHEFFRIHKPPLKKR